MGLLGEPSDLRTTLHVLPDAHEFFSSLCWVGLGGQERHRGCLAEIEGVKSGDGLQVSPLSQRKVDLGEGQKAQQEEKAAVT